MPSLKDIKSRITNVATAEKVTFSMKNIAAAKLSQARRFYIASSDYLSINNEILQNILLAYTENNIIIDNSFIANFFKLNKTLPKLLVVMGADRGLCGAFNANIIKKTENLIKEYKAQSEDFLIFPIGNKIRAYFNNHYENNVVVGFRQKMDLKTFTMEQALLIAHNIFNLFSTEKVGSLAIVYTEFISVLHNEVAKVEIFPIDFANIIPGSVGKGKSMASKVKEHTIDLNIVTDIFIEDSISEIVKNVILSWVYKIVIESLTAEHAARVNAMDNSYNNAGELLKKLSLEYNRTRQALITKELIEIIAGTEAI